MIALVLLIALSLNANAQKKTELAWPALNIDKQTELITYTAVPEVAGVAAPELYDRAYEWIKGYYKNYAEKLRKSDKEAGEIEVLGRFPVYAYDKKGVRTSSTQALIQYTLKLMFKDGRFKYEISSFNAKATSNQPLEKWLDKEDVDAANHALYLTDVDTEMQALIKDMKSAIASPKKASGDEW